MNEADIQNVIDEIEAEQSKDKISAVRIFRSLVNQPDFVAINSNDKADTDSSLGFSDFTINLPRPILEAQSIQLVSATIPNCVQNIPDTACVFWYYKLSSYTGLLPCINNLHCVRLLPSYYKQELILNPQNYGFNKTFNDYTELAAELDKACKADFAYDGYISDQNPLQKVKFEPIFIPNDISITYDESQNKFLMTGLNSDVEPTVAPWANGVLYKKDSFVSFSGLLYVANVDTRNQPTSPFWSVFDQDSDLNFSWNRYLIAGPNDTNVIKLQNNINRPWEPNFVFETNSVVEYDGTAYTNVRQSQNQAPGQNNTDWQPTGTLKQIGLNKFTQYYDFEYSTVLGIPGQPFNLIPKRLLNSILGFTWNGAFKTSDFGVLYNFQGSSLGNTTLLNKLRPLNYGKLGTGGTPRPDFSTKSSVYTADGYCNLVYSSTAQIYGSVVQGSTLNSTTSTGLLGSVMLNAKNLGVSYFQEGFSSPLSIFGSDIFSLSFQIKDDMNEPYFLTNNAVMILVLKITYR